MSESGPEPDLRDRFAALRREDGRGTPPFAAVWQAAQTRRPRPAPRRRLVALAAVAAVAAAIACFLFLGPIWKWAPPPPPPAQRATGPSLADWRPPTDFLLQTPGREILAAPSWLERGFAAEIPEWGSGSPPPAGERRQPS